MLAREIAQREEPLLQLLQPAGIGVEIAGQAVQLLHRLRQLRLRAVEGGDRGIQPPAGLVGDPVEAAPRLIEQGLAAALAAEILQRRLQRLAELGAMHHQAALFGQPRFLAGLGLDRGQLFGGVAQK